MVNPRSPNHKYSLPNRFVFAFIFYHKAKYCIVVIASRFSIELLSYTWKITKKTVRIML